VIQLEITCHTSKSEAEPDKIRLQAWEQFHFACKEVYTILMQSTHKLSSKMDFTSW